MKKINPIKIFKELDPACVNKQGPLFEKQFIDNMRRIEQLELSNAQINRITKLISFISQGYQKREFDFYTVTSIVFKFATMTMGKNKDQIKSIFRSFQTLPRFHRADMAVTGKKYKGLNSNEKNRDSWGAPSMMDEELNGKEYYTRYIRTLKIIKKINK